MKNTLENKINFFTQYWGQFILTHENWDSEDGIFGVHAKSMLFVEEDEGEGYYLELKSTKKLTKKHLKKCQFNLSEGAKVDINGEYWIGYDKNNYYLGEGTLLPCNVDYLRSQGFAMPFKGVSVETMIGWGWIKIVN